MLKQLRPWRMKDYRPEKRLSELNLQIACVFNDINFWLRWLPCPESPKFKHGWLIASTHRLCSFELQGTSSGDRTGIGFSSLHQSGTPPSLCTGTEGCVGCSSWKIPDSRHKSRRRNVFPMLCLRTLCTAPLVSLWGWQQMQNSFRVFCSRLMAYACHLGHFLTSRLGFWVRISCFPQVDWIPSLQQLNIQNAPSFRVYAFLTKTLNKLFGHCWTPVLTCARDRSILCSCIQKLLLWRRGSGPYLPTRSPKLGGKEQIWLRFMSFAEV